MADIGVDEPCPAHSSPNQATKLDVIGLDAAIAMTGISRSTWWRRISRGVARKLKAPGSSRTMLALSDVIPDITMRLSQTDIELLIEAEEGDADAQADIGAMFASAGQYAAAFHWLQRSANQGCADAMQWLGMVYASGNAVARDEVSAITWIARAASLGHAIAREQMRFIQIAPEGFCRNKTVNASRRERLPGTAVHDARPAHSPEIREPLSTVRKQGKNDPANAADAAATCEAVQRPDMSFVPIKSLEQRN